MVGISFAPGTSAPAPVTPAALSEEAIDLLRSLTVGQSTILNAIQGVERQLQQTNAYLEGIHSGQAAHQRAFQTLASALMAAIVPVSSLPLQLPPPKKLASARRERGKKSGNKAAPRGTGGSVDPAAPPSKVGKGHTKTGKSGKTCTADKTATSTAAKDTAATSTAAKDTAATSTAEEDTAATSTTEEDTAATSTTEEDTAATSTAEKDTAATSTAEKDTTATSTAGH
ncbi:hypothetical protein NDU88_002914 [Pleurodeles waltl]|uniref:Uncharacterized protein n=1 Tax=Pleurodeles waltl TaxID=8319 RepID=A0AAV7VF51_PLEWA|nr:hypothetical protein NDU88_002914 [Pleurodeles waltl]